MPHTGGSKSIATLMDVQTANGREPTGVEIFLLTHKQRVDGRPLDDDSAKVLGNERSGYVRDLGLGPTPSALWGSRSFLENIDEEDLSNEIVHEADSGHGQIAQTRGIPIVAENTPTSHGITHLYPSMRLFELLFESKFILILARP
ncbi:hypothetical protein KY284_010500 [Solanum tuberosum]|nr:hypothetical protein KY284_010500 [Solanum tuberosum]